VCRERAASEEDQGWEGHIQTSANGRSTLDVIEDAREMKRTKARGFAAVEPARLVGKGARTGIVNIAPALIDTMEEKSEIRLPAEPRETSALAGYCDECGAWSEDLGARDGWFLCSDCISDLEEQT